MISNEIRQRFLRFFEERGHRVVRSSSLVPAQDPTLLFANAGMNQFKDVFLGREKRDYVRACSSQKCVRAGGKHNDLEQVGRTARHHTFFEMLGNFSFGDYFKKQAIPWAWELITKEFALPREKLYVTVFREDDEAEDIWAKDVGVPRERIFRLDEKDNFWQMGDTGPCGPCSEIHYDLGPAASDLGHQDCAFPCECGRYIELWNLVFMQFNRVCDKWEEDPNKPRVCLEYHDEPLPKPSVDTGAGLERLAAVLQGKLSNFDTDLFRPLIEEAATLASVEYGTNHDTDVSLRIIADHARAATFLISDGVVPSNEGRGYVLRLILRRALYHGQTLGLDQPFMFQLSGRVVDLMKDAYPELVETAPHVAKAIKTEEGNYARTTRIGLEIMDGVQIQTALADQMTFGELRSNSKKKHQQIVGSGLSPLAKIPGWELFKLHDTFGLRPEFVADIAKNYRVEVDLEGYNAEMAKQRDRARANWRAIEKKLALPAYLKLSETHKSDFLGYEAMKVADCQVVAILPRGIDELMSEAVPGRGPTEIEVILDRTPFYAEAGGQAGDTGWFTVNGEKIARVEGTYSPVAGIIAHRIRWAWPPPGFILRKGELITAEVEEGTRHATMRNHTGTHLLHAALRKVLGTHVKQAGSLVVPERLRFDFTHYAGLNKQDLLDIENLVNEQILKNEAVTTEVMDREAAENSGAMALFDEKYSDKVRVVSINDFSKELCGGTHVRRTGDIGAFKIISEGSVAAGIRRIEALTGEGVLKHVRETSETLAQLSQALRAKPDELLAAVEKLTEGEKKLRKELDALQMKRAAAQAGDLVETATEVKGVRVVAARVEAADRNALRQMVDELRPKLGSGVIFLGAVVDGKVTLIAAVTKDLTNRLDAGKIVKAAAVMVEGSGGGRKDLAEAGGKNPEKLDEALKAVPSIIEQML